MKPIAVAAVEAGLVPGSALDELARWGVHVTAEPKENILQSPESVVAHLREALEGEAQVRIDETDLDILHCYLSPDTQKKGRLILKEGKRHSTMPISFCLTKMGDYAIPWTDSDTPEVLANGETHLRWEDEDGVHDVYFLDVREVFFGTKKAFAICTPVKDEEDD